MCEAGMCAVQQTAHCTTMHVRRRSTIRTSEACCTVPLQFVVLLFYSNIVFQIAHTVNFTANCIVLLHCFCMYGPITHCNDARQVRRWQKTSCRLQYIRRRADVLHAYASVLSGTIRTHLFHTHNSLQCLAVQTELAQMTYCITLITAMAIPTKCKVMHFGYKNNTAGYSLGNVNIQSGKEEKDLGIIINQRCEH